MIVHARLFTPVSRPGSSRTCRTSCCSVVRGRHGCPQQVVDVFPEEAIHEQELGVIVPNHVIIRNPSIEYKLLLPPTLIRVLPPIPNGRQVSLSLHAASFTSCTHTEDLGYPIWVHPAADSYTTKFTLCPSCQCTAHHLSLLPFSSAGIHLGSPCEAGLIFAKDEAIAGACLCFPWFRSRDGVFCAS
jgi:hypothetical protein